MKTTTFLRSYLYNNILFYITLAINLLFIVKVKYFPTLDGPAHLYNSFVLKEIILGNEAFSEFLHVNAIFLPNWFSHAFLSTLLLIFPGWLSEKLLIIFYVTGMALSFKYLISTINKDNKYLSILIFPFIYTFVFHLGFYNFSISFIFLFFTLGYYIRLANNKSTLKYIALLFLLLLTYYCNILVFGMLGLTLGSYIFFETISNHKKQESPLDILRRSIKPLSTLLLVSLPSLILAFFFVNNIKMSSSNQGLPFKDLISWINDARPYIIYDYSGDKIITEQYFHILLVFITVTFIFIEKPLRKKLYSGFFLLIPMVLSLLMLFLIPDNSGAGMMSIRFIILFFVFLLIEICVVAVNKKINYFLIACMILLHIGIQFKHFNGNIKKLNYNAIEMTKTSKYIDENSIVLPVDMTGSWLHHHFSNYVGTEKPLLLLENYEASIAWFPLRWADNTFPDIKVNGTNKLSGIYWHGSSAGGKKKSINNILIYGDHTKLSDTKYNELNQLIKNDYTLIYHSKDDFIFLYKLNTDI